QPVRSADVVTHRLEDVLLHKIENGDRTFVLDVRRRPADRLVEFHIDETRFAGTPRTHSADPRDSALLKPSGHELQGLRLAPERLPRGRVRAAVRGRAAG